VEVLQGILGVDPDALASEDDAEIDLLPIEAGVTHVVTVTGRSWNG